jgi:signal transduction histidine kinase
MISETTPVQPESGQGDSLKEALRKIPIFSDLTEEQLEWFASNSEDLHLNSGDILINDGDPADSLFVIIEGEMRGRREIGTPDAPMFIAQAGQVTGMLPFSRLTVFHIVSRAFGRTRVARFHKDHFPEMMQRIPELTPRLVGVLADRIREVSRADQQRDKLTALGKLSAGLAHELNNPASAARRAAEGLRQCTRDLRKANARLDKASLSPEQRSVIAEIENCVIDAMGSSPALDSLVQSDREDELTTWLEQHGVPNGGRFAAGLVEANVERDDLEHLTEKFDSQALPDVLTRVVSALSAERLTRELEATTGRISELVKAIKEYTYMDQLPEQEIDIHQGIDSTLTMLKFRLKKGVTVIREYDKSIPRLFAHGSELNQVWTNLIDNAIDAMGGKGELRIRTAQELDMLLIEIVDNGPGIPPAVLPRIFDPFFTTKGVGEGTGLGLDTVYRIVRSHHGEISVESRPGHTCFRIRLPLQQPKGGEKS